MEKSLKISFIFKEILWFVPLVVFMVFEIYKNASVPLADFSNYYFGAFFQSKHQTETWLYDPAVFNEEIEKAGFSGIFASYSPNPPAIAIFFLPFTFFSPFIAKLIFNISGSVAFLFFLFRWFRVFSIDKRWVLVIPVLFFRPIIANIYQGQVYFLLLILLVEGYLFFRKEQYVFSSLLWTAAIFLKIFPIILFLYLLASRKFKAFFWLSGASIFFFLLCLSIQSTEVWMTFLTTILPKASNGEVMDNFAISFQSWNVFFRYLFIDDEIANPNPLFANEAANWTSMWLIKALVLSISAYFVVRNKDIYRSFALLIVSGLLLTPTGSVYSMVLWMVFFISILSSPVSSLKEKWILGLQLGVLFLICNIPFHNFSDLPLVFRFSRLFLMTLLWLSLLSEKDFSILYFVTFLLILGPLHLGKILFSPEKDNAHYLPVSQKQLMITGFGIENNRLFYTYRNEKGLGKEVTDFEVKSFENQAVTLKNNILFYKEKPVLHSTDIKKSQVLVNQSHIVYLSDKNRGPGFYAIRIIPIHARK